MSKAKGKVVCVCNHKGDVGKTMLSVPKVEMIPSRQLLEELPELRRKHDCIVIDTPPLATIDLFRIIKDADYALVPITPGGFELDALQSLLAIVPLDRTRIILNRATSSNATTTTRRALNKLSLP